jgi:hypothetical protein
MPRIRYIIRVDFPLNHIALCAMISNISIISKPIKPLARSSINILQHVGINRHDLPDFAINRLVDHHILPLDHLARLNISVLDVVLLTSVAQQHRGGHYLGGGHHTVDAVLRVAVFHRHYLFGVGKVNVGEPA